MGKGRFFVVLLLVLYGSSSYGDISDLASQALSKAQEAQMAVQRKTIQLLLSRYKKPFAHSNDIAVVRTTNTLGNDEVAFRSAREPIIRIGLSKLLGRTVLEKRLPTIGLCMSGGGYRAMLLSMAFMSGLQKIGALDASMYAVALSGSTWSLAYWLASGKTSRGALDTLIKIAGRGQILPVSEWNDLATVILTKIASEQVVSIVDLWGAYLVEQIFSDVSNQQNYVFSQLAPRVASGQVPFPIGTMVSDNIISSATQYQWFECSPFEMGSTFLQAWIPTWAAGRTFKNGKSVNAVPEQTLGFWLGIFGSAFSLSIGDIINRAPYIFLSKDLIKRYLKPLAQPVKDVTGVQRVIPGGKIPNFAFGLESTPEVARKKLIVELVDAGLGGNLPVPPLLRPERRLDIIIMCDASSPIAGGSELKRAQKYAQQNGLAFPSIDYNRVGRQNISVFGNPSDLKSLVVIYIPCVNNSSLPTPYGQFDMDAAASLTGFAGTHQLSYSLNNATLMTGYFEQNVIAQKAAIRDVIQKRLKALNP